MKQTSLVPPGRSSLLQTASAFLLALGLTAELWIATGPLATARMMSPEELIEAGLPPGVMLKTADKPQFLTAVCAAAKNHRGVAPALARNAVAAHPDYAGDIVATVVRCAEGNCDLTGEIVAAATSAAPDSAAIIDDAAMGVAPDCADYVQGATTRDGKQLLGDGKEILGDGKEILPAADIPREGPRDFNSNVPVPQPPLPGTVGAGGFPPQNSTVQICDNGQQRTIAASRLSHFLETHPGAFAGRCQVTPVVSR